MSWGLLLVTCTGSLLSSARAAALLPGRTLVLRAGRAHVTRVHCTETAEDEPPQKFAMTWQEGLERLLSPNTPAADRDVLLRDLLSRGPEIADEVTRAIGTGDLQSLAPPDGEGKRVLDDLEAVRRQVVDDLLPQATSEAQTLLSDPATVANEVQRAAQDAADAAPQTMTAVNTLLQDPAR